MRILIYFTLGIVFALTLAGRAQEVWTNQCPDILVSLFGNGLIVTAGEVIKISPDGRNWTTLQEGPFAFMRSGAYGNNRFLLSTGSLLGCSTNGVLWDYSSDFKALSIKFHNDRFWAVGAPSDDTGPPGIFSSTNGSNWSPEFRAGTPITSLTLGNNGFLAASSTNAMTRLFFSDDGSIWNEIAPLARHVRTIGQLHGIYLAETQDGNNPIQILSSTNLTDWHPISLPTTNAFSTMYYSDGQFRAAFGGTIYSSSDLSNWTREAQFDVEFLNSPLERPEGVYLFGTRGWILFSPKAGEWEVLSPSPQYHPETLHEVAYQPPNFYAAGSTSIVSSVDGIRWIESKTNVGPISAFGKLGTNLFALGPGTGFRLKDQSWSAVGMNPKFAPISVTSDGRNLIAVAPHAIFKSSDGANWSLTFTNSNLHVTDVAYGNGHFVSLGTNPQNPTGVTSTNGTDWSFVTVGVPNQTLTGIVYGNGTFLAAQEAHDTNSVPSNYTDLYASTSGSNWTRITSSPPQPAGRLAFANGLFFILTSDSIAFSSDGVNWEINEANYEDRANKVLFDIAYGGLRYVAVGGTVVTSTRSVSLDILNEFNLELSAGPGDADATTIEESNDLVNWGPVHAIGGNIANGYDINTARSVQRFFRAKQIP